MKYGVREIYFHGANDRDLLDFIDEFVSSGLFWIYIVANPKKEWERIYKRLAKNKLSLFKKEYNKAFLLVNSYKEFTKLFLGKKIDLKNLFLRRAAMNTPEMFIGYDKTDELRWREIIELMR